MTDHFRITIVAPLPEDHRERAQAILDLYGALDTVRQAFDAVTGVAVAVKEEIVPAQPAEPAPKRGRPAKGSFKTFIEQQPVTPPAETFANALGVKVDDVQRIMSASDPGIVPAPLTDADVSFVLSQQTPPAPATVGHRGRKVA